MVYIRIRFTETLLKVAYQLSSLAPSSKILISFCKKLVNTLFRRIEFKNNVTTPHFFLLNIDGFVLFKFMVVETIDMAERVISSLQLFL